MHYLQESDKKRNYLPAVEVIKLTENPLYAGRVSVSVDAL